MNLTVDIQCASVEPVPEEEDIRRWIDTTLVQEATHQEAEISLRLVDLDEMANLNKTYRGKSAPTNVLSFPADLPEGVEAALLGDIIICAPVVRDEAVQQGKDVQAHWAHMAVHGTLHLLGYDHIEDADAQRMETLESAILHTLNFPCPYNDSLHGERVTQ